MFKYVQELKNRVFLTLLCWLKTFIVVYLNKEIFLWIIIQPIVQNSEEIFNHFIFTKITELFNTYIELVFFISNQIILIYIIYHIICYIAPALYYKEYKILKQIFQLINIFWIFTILFLQTYFISFILIFFFSFQNQFDFECINIQFESKIYDYLKFYIKIYYICNFQFYFFIFLIVFLIYSNQNIKSLTKIKKNFYFLFLLIATIVTTSDLLNQLFVLFNLILFFEFILVIRLFKNKLIKKIGD